MGAPTLLGRRGECETLDRLLASARAGKSSVIVVRGEAGCGKTTLLDYVAERASGFRIARVVGAETEMELAFAGLHQLCAPMLPRRDSLPAPQRGALEVAFGLKAGDAPDAFLVGLAVLSLLADLAETQPLACLVDDAQWLDKASVQVLAFVARRLAAERLALVFSLRDPFDDRHLVGLPQLAVQPLSDSHARMVLASAYGRLDDRVRDRILAEARGNPLALLHLPFGLTPTELAGGFGLPAAAGTPGRIEDSFQRQLLALPRDTQRLVLTAAAEPTGDVTLLWRAATSQGIDAGAAAPAVAAGLLDVGIRVRFRHPLVRSAVYRSASLSEQRAVHQALADATDPDSDADRRAWHRAQAAPGPDRAVADELERAADRALARGGLAAAAAFLERAAELSPDPALGRIRVLAAAQAELDAGAPDKAHLMLDAAALGDLDEFQQARLDRLRAEVAFTQRRGNDAPALLLGAANRLAALDSALARETYLEALGAALFAGRLGGSSTGVRQIAEAALTAPPASRPRDIDLLLDGLAARYAQGYVPALVPLRRALSALLPSRRSGEAARWLWLACRVATELWDDEGWHELASWQVQLARDNGALAVLPIALTYRAGVAVHAGDFTAAAAMIDEADAISRSTGNAPLRYTSLVLSAWRGDEPQTLDLIRISRDDAGRRGEGRALALADYITAVLYNGLGRYSEALTAAGRAADYDDLGLCGWALVELIEAAARTGDLDHASAALQRLDERTRASGTDWALGVLTRSQAMLTDGEAADALFQDSIERLSRTRIAIHLARSELLYGEWLRCTHRNVEARDQLRRAHSAFTHIGADGFAERARNELLATGETVRKKAPTTAAELTPEETYIVRLVCNGMTNPEIGAQMFLSPRTVEWHLHKVFTKLDVTSRKELRRVMATL